MPSLAAVLLLIAIGAMLLWLGILGAQHLADRIERGIENDTEETTTRSDR